MENEAFKEQHGKREQELGLYLHIPFCVKKCDYCDFLSAPASQETIDRYFEAMLAELGQYENCTGDCIVPTIFIGGGTPSCVETGYIERLMEAVNRIFKVDWHRLEATIEINPGTITEDKLKSYQRAGINRLSFGLQSADNGELARLGRIHTYEQFEENYRLARALGFHNINVDLMSAIPGQTPDSWERTLNRVLSLEPEHISAYSLIIEEGTSFYDRYREGTEGFGELPGEEEDRRMYYRTKEILQANGYYRYEISNYAKNAFQCRHNTSYWICKDYLGIGLGASSLLDSARFSNLHGIEQYINLCNLYKKNNVKARNIDTQKNKEKAVLEDFIGLRRNIELLTEQQKMEEFMFLGLRRMAGISINTFVERFGIELEAVYGETVKRGVKDKLLEIQGDHIRLTEYGIDISNYVLAGFLLD